MDWSGLGERLASLGLTTLGGLLGGPAGAAVGTMAGKALGLSAPDSPEQVKAALDADPNGSIAVLQKLELERGAELRRMEHDLRREVIREVNRTARAEARSEDAYVRRARPTLTYAVAAIVMMQVLLAGAVVLITPEHIGQLGTLYAALAVPQSLLTAFGGTYIQARTTDKAVAAGHPPAGGLLAAMAARIRGKA